MRVMTEEALTVLRRIPMLSSRTDCELAVLVGAMQELALEPGEAVTPAPEGGWDLLIVLDGDAEVLQRDHPVARLQGGQFYGAAPIEGRTCIAGIRALTSTRALLTAR